MRERATLRLADVREVRVEVIREDSDSDEILVRRLAGVGAEPPALDLIAAVDAHLSRASAHVAGTTDRLLAADRDRAY